MNRTIYVAARRADAPAAREVAYRLRTIGHQTTSLWHDADASAIERERTEQDAVRRRDAARRHYDGVQRADTLLFLAHPDACDAMLEAMTAYRYGHDVVAVGDRMALTAMIDLPGIRWFASVGDAMAYLSGPGQGAREHR